MDRLQEESAAPSPSTSTAPGSPAPSGEYTDYILRSGPVETGWRYNIMKFGALDKEYIDPSSDVFVKPVKLNRKDPRTVRRLTDEERDKMNAKAAVQHSTKSDTVLTLHTTFQSDMKCCILHVTPTWAVRCSVLIPKSDTSNGLTL